MPHTLPSTHSPLAALVAWFRRQRDADDFAGIDAGEAQRIASDLNMSLDDLVTVSRQSDDEIELMARMMAAHGLTRAALEKEMPEVVRLMAVTCAKCDCKGRCSSDLDAGTARQNSHRYCPNTDSIAVLSD